jgi:hypothetical protein
MRLTHGNRTHGDALHVKPDNGRSDCDESEAQRSHQHHRMAAQHTTSHHSAALPRHRKRSLSGTTRLAHSPVTMAPNDSAVPWELNARHVYTPADAGVK